MFLFWDLPSLSSRTTTRQSRGISEDKYDSEKALFIMRRRNQGLQSVLQMCSNGTLYEICQVDAYKTMSECDSMTRQSYRS